QVQQVQQGELRADIVQLFYQGEEGEQTEQRDQDDGAGAVDFLGKIAASGTHRDSVIGTGKPVRGWRERTSITKVRRRPAGTAWRKCGGKAPAAVRPLDGCGQAALEWTFRPLCCGHGLFQQPALTPAGQETA